MRSVWEELPPFGRLPARRSIIWAVADIKVASAAVALLKKAKYLEPIQGLGSERVQHRNRALNGAGTAINGLIAASARKEGIPTAFLANIPEFVKLAEIGKARGITWETRTELYQKLMLSDDDRVKVETKVVEYATYGKLPGEWIKRMVMHNLFYLCENGKGEPVYEQDFRWAHRMSRSALEGARRLGVEQGTFYELIRRMEKKDNGRRHSDLQMSSRDRNGEWKRSTRELLRETLEGVLPEDLLSD